MTSDVLALLIIGLQVVMIVVLLIFVRRFGAYADALEQTHRSNLDLIGEVQDIRQTVARLAAGQPPPSDTPEEFCA